MAVAASLGGDCAVGDGLRQHRRRCPAKDDAGEPAAKPVASKPASSTAKSADKTDVESRSPTTRRKTTQKSKGEAKSAAGEIEPADNSYCIVCHLNYETEKLTTGHQIAGVGCAKCHGESEKHSGDEDGLTPPDVMFAQVTSTSSA